MATQPIDARVIQLPHGFKVVPPDVFKHAHEQFTLANLTDSTVHVSFPRLPTDPARAVIQPWTLQVFDIGTTAPGVYEYLVEIAGFPLRASGHSDPHIIIDF